VIGSQLSFDHSHSWQLSLSELAAFPVDDEESSISDQPQAIEASFGNGKTAKRFYRIEEKACKLHRVKRNQENTVIFVSEKPDRKTGHYFNRRARSRMAKTTGHGIEIFR